MQATGDFKGYYRILGVSRTATTEEVRAAFRDRAKLYHPDHGGELADEDRFRLLREAYEVLRDPKRRLQYDSEGLRMAREAAAGAGRGGAPPRGGSRPGGAWNGGARPRRPPRSRRRPVAPRRISRASVVATVLAVAVLVVLGLWWSTVRQLELRNVQIADLYFRLNNALAGQAESRSHYRASAFGLLDETSGTATNSSHSFLYTAEVQFPDGSTSLDGDMERRLRSAAIAISDQIDRIPKDGVWTVLVLGYADKAARPDGAAMLDWENTLTRMAKVVDFLAGQGIPAERFTSRFEAGFNTTGNPDANARVIQVRLVCCGR